MVHVTSIKHQAEGSSMHVLVVFAILSVPILATYILYQIEASGNHLKALTYTGIMNIGRLRGSSLYVHEQETFI